MIKLKEIGILILLLLLVSCKNQGTSKKSDYQDSLPESLTADSLLVKDPGSLKTVALPDIENSNAMHLPEHIQGNIIGIGLRKTENYDK